MGWSTSISRLIRDTRTRKFLKNGGWTESPDEALHFESVSDAVRVSIRLDPGRTELVYFPEPKDRRWLADLRAAQSKWASNFRNSRS